MVPQRIRVENHPRLWSCQGDHPFVAGSRPTPPSRTRLERQTKLGTVVSKQLSFFQNPRCHRIYTHTAGVNVTMRIARRPQWTRSSEPLAPLMALISTRVRLGVEVSWTIRPATRTAPDRRLIRVTSVALNLGTRCHRRHDSRLRCRRDGRSAQWNCT